MIPMTGRVILKTSILGKSPLDKPLKISLGDIPNCCAMRVGMSAAFSYSSLNQRPTMAFFMGVTLISSGCIPTIAVAE